MLECPPTSVTQSVILERMVKPEYQNAAEEDVDWDFAVHFTYRILSGLVS